MKIKLSKSQWSEIGNKTGWMKKKAYGESELVQAAKIYSSIKKLYEEKKFKECRELFNMYWKGCYRNLKDRFGFKTLNDAGAIGDNEEINRFLNCQDSEVDKLLKLIINLEQILSNEEEGERDGVGENIPIPENFSTPTFNDVDDSKDKRLDNFKK